MAREVLFDTSGFFALLDQADAHHEHAKEWLRAEQDSVRPVSTEWIVGETCTLLVARKRPYLVTRFLDQLEQSRALLLVNPDDTLLQSAKALIRQRAERGYSFVDCLSFCLMKERRIQQALTTDEHFQSAGYTALLK